MRLLALDASFFLPLPAREDADARLFEWSQSEEDPYLYESIWHVRAGLFLQAGVPLPRLDDEAIRTFWQRFIFDQHTTLFYGDSGAGAGADRITRGVQEVWSFAPFHNAGYTRDAFERGKATGRVDSATWMLAHFANGATLHHRYPSWKPWGFDVEPRPTVPVGSEVDDGHWAYGRPMGRVYLYKSPAWMPSWCDDQWAQLIEAAPFRRKISTDSSKLVRTFDPHQAELMRLQIDEAIEIEKRKAEDASREAEAAREG